MINYSVSGNIRIKVVFLFTLASVGLYLLLIHYVPANVRLTIVASIFSFLFWLFDKFFWKIKALYPLLGVPCFSGSWMGTIASSKMNEKKKVTVFITQTWTKISITLEDGDTLVTSSSNSAYIISNENYKFLSYSYDFQNSEGFCKLRYDNKLKRDKLIGAYFTSLPSSGKLELRRVKK